MISSAKASPAWTVAGSATIGAFLEFSWDESGLPLTSENDDEVEDWSDDADVDRGVNDESVLVSDALIVDVFDIVLVAALPKFVLIRMLTGVLG